MNFAILRHLVLKDVRHQRIRLILIWTIASLVPLTNFLQDEHLLPFLSVVKIGVIGFFYLLLLFSLISVILLDPTCGTTRFLKTRPVDWRTLAASKATFVLLFLYAPLFVFRLMTIWTSDVHLSLADQALCLLELTIIAGGVTAPLVFPAFFFQRLTTVIMVVAGSAIGVYLLALFIAALGAYAGFSDQDMQALGLTISRQENGNSALVSGFLLACIVLGVTVIVVSILRYWRPAVAIPLTLVCGGFFLALVYFFYVPWLIDKVVSDYAPPPKIGDLPSPMRDQIHIRLENLTVDTSRSWDDSNRAKKSLESHLIEKLSIEGVDEPFLLWGTGRDLKVILPSGKKVTFTNAEHKMNHPSEERISEYLRQECAGAKPDPTENANYQMGCITTFTGHDDRAHLPDVTDSELTGASVQRSWEFTVARIKILKIAPFLKGVRYDSPRSCFEVLQVRAESGVIRYLQNDSTVPLLLRGDFEVMTDPYRVETHPFVIINRKTGEILDDKEDLTADDLFSPRLSWMTLSRPRPNQSSPQIGPPPPLPANWLDDADICFYKVEEVGTVVFSYSTTVTNVIR
jgi:hypothetical protein